MVSEGGGWLEGFEDDVTSAIFGVGKLHGDVSIRAKEEIPGQADPDQGGDNHRQSWSTVIIAVDFISSSSPSWLYRFKGVFRGWSRSSIQMASDSGFHQSGQNPLFIEFSGWGFEARGCEREASAVARPGDPPPRSCRHDARTRGGGSRHLSDGTPSPSSPLLLSSSSWPIDHPPWHHNQGGDSWYLPCRPGHKPL